MRNIQHFEGLELRGGEMERTGVRASSKIRGGKGVPSSPGSAASSLTAQVVGNLIRTWPVAEENGGVVGMGHLQMADLGATNSQDKGQSTSGQGEDSERVRSHTRASTSLRCGFHWLHKELEERLATWSSEEGEDMDASAHTYKFITVGSSSLKHVIGRGGRMLHKLESFVGVFASVQDIADGPIVCFVGCPHACLLAEFIVEMIEGGLYSIIESLARNGFYMAI